MSAAGSCRTAFVMFNSVKWGVRFADLLPHSDYPHACVGNSVSRRGTGLFGPLVLDRALSVRHLFRAERKPLPSMGVPFAHPSSVGQRGNAVFFHGGAQRPQRFRQSLLRLFCLAGGSAALALAEGMSQNLPRKNFVQVI